MQTNTVAAQPRILAHPLSSPVRGNTCAVVVTCNPPEDFRPRIGLIRDQVCALVIVDNGSSPSSSAGLRAESNGVNVVLVRNAENLGIAEALNQGIEWAMDAGCSWALLLDQDTIPQSTMLQVLARAYDDYPAPHTVAIVGSNYTESGADCSAPLRAPTHALSWMETPVAITAGSLLRLQAFRSIGPFRANYFIDCVDMEYCLRARSMGLKIIVATTPLMTARIGQPTQHILPWRTIVLSNHPPVRRYYMIRNHIDMAKTYFFREPLYILKSLWERFKSTVLVCFFEKDRAAKTWFAVIGLLDGLLGKFNRKVN